MNIYSSLISSNKSSGAGGGIFSSGNTLEIYSSLISSNTAGTDDGKLGGGLYLSRADTKIISSTITSNTANQGGGIYVDVERKLDFVNSTIVDNDYYPSGPSEQAFYYNAPSSIIRFAAVNSIIGDSTGSFLNASSQIRYLYTYLKGFFSRDIRPDVIELSVIGTAPNPRPLADNGGEVQTMEIPEGSSAINAGTYVGYDEDDNLCFDFTPDTSTRDWRRADSTDFNSPENCTEPVSEITVDGRGYDFNGRPDIGAFEYMGNVPSN